MQKAKKEPAKLAPKKAEKEPIEMTTDELLDAVIAPKVAEKLRELVRESDDRPKPLGSE